MADIDILLVADGDDVQSLERAFDDSGRPGRLHVVATGGEAVSWLHRDEGFEDVPYPDLLLVDLSTEGGASALETVKSDARHRRLPVLVVVDPDDRSDLETAYDNHANACLRRPAEADDYAALARNVTAFWAASAELPIPYDEEGPPP